MQVVRRADGGNAAPLPQRCCCWTAPCPIGLPIADFQVAIQVVEKKAVPGWTAPVVMLAPRWPLPSTSENALREPGVIVQPIPWRRGSHHGQLLGRRIVGRGEEILVPSRARQPVSATASCAGKHAPRSRRPATSQRWRSSCPPCRRTLYRLCRVRQSREPFSVAGGARHAPGQVGRPHPATRAGPAFAEGTFRRVPPFAAPPPVRPGRRRASPGLLSPPCIHQRVGPAPARRSASASPGFRASPEPAAHHEVAPIRRDRRHGSGPARRPCGPVPCRAGPHPGRDAHPQPSRSGGAEQLARRQPRPRARSSKCRQAARPSGQPLGPGRRAYIPPPGGSVSRTRDTAPQPAMRPAPPPARQRFPHLRDQRLALAQRRRPGVPG